MKLYFIINKEIDNSIRGDLFFPLMKGSRNQTAPVLSRGW